MLKLSPRPHLALQLGRLTLLAALAAVMGVAAVTHAQITPWPVTLTMTGPVTAMSGQDVAYRVQYHLTDPSTVSQTGFQISIPRNTTYVSSEVVSGPTGIILRLEQGFVQWGGLGNAKDTEGAVEMIVKIDADFVGSIATRAIEPGTETASSNIVETQVFAPGTLPETENACGRPREPGEVAILGQIDPPVDHGTVRIPELDLTSEIVDGCFEFRNITLPQDPMLVSIEIRVENYRPVTWANYIVLGTGLGPNFTPRLEPGDEPKLIDPCPSLLATPQMELSAAQSRQAQLCAQLPATGTLPETGGGFPPASSGPPVFPALLALAGAALIFAGAATRRRWVR